MNLRFVSFVCLCFLGFGCGSVFKIPNKNFVFKKIDSLEIKVFWQELNNNPKALKFNTNVEVYGKEVKGILLIKPLSDSVFRTTFLANGAVKLFDMELHPDTTIVFSKASQLSNPKVIETIANDLNLVAGGLHRKIEAGKEFKNVKSEQTIFETVYGQGLLFYTFQSNKIQSLTKTNTKKRIDSEVEFSEFKEAIPNRIKLRHFRFKLQIDLTLAE